MRLFETSSFELKEQSNPNSIFYVDHLYSRWQADGSRDISAETHLQIDHENALTEFLDNLVQRLSRPEEIRLDQQERQYLVRVCVRLLLRNPQFVEWFASRWRFKVARWLLKISLKWRPKVISAIERSRMSPKQAADAEIRAYAATFDITALVGALSSERRILLLTPAQGVQSFVLGKQPCLLQGRKWYEDENGDWHFEDSAMEVYAVLDPHLMVGLVTTSETDDLRLLSSEDVQRINGLIVKYSDEVVARNASDLHGAWYKIFEGEETIRSAKKIPEGIDTLQLSVNEASEP